MKSSRRTQGSNEVSIMGQAKKLSYEKTDQTA